MFCYDTINLNRVRLKERGVYKSLFLIGMVLLFWINNGSAEENYSQKTLEISKQINYFDILPNENVEKILDYVGYYDSVSLARTFKVNKRFYTIKGDTQEALCNSEEVRDTLENTNILFENLDHLVFLPHKLSTEEAKPIELLISRILNIQSRQGPQFSYDFKTAILAGKKMVMLDNLLKENRDLNREKALLVQELRPFLTKYKSCLDVYRLGKYKIYTFQLLKNYREYFNVLNGGFLLFGKRLNMDAIYFENLKNFSNLIEYKGSKLTHIAKKTIEKMKTAIDADEFKKLFDTMKQEIKEKCTIFVQGQSKSFEELVQELEIALNQKLTQIYRMGNKIRSEVKFYGKELPEFLDQQDQRIKSLSLKASQKNGKRKIISGLKKQKANIRYLRKKAKENESIFMQECVNIDSIKTYDQFIEYWKKLEERLKNLNISLKPTEPSFPELDQLEQQIKELTERGSPNAMKKNIWHLLRF